MSDTQIPSDQVIRKQEMYHVVDLWFLFSQMTHQGNDSFRILGGGGTGALVKLPIRRSNFLLVRLLLQQRKGRLSGTVTDVWESLWYFTISHYHDRGIVTVRVSRELVNWQKACFL